MRAWTNLKIFAAVTALGVSLGACADMADMFEYGDAKEHAEMESAHLWEISLMAGRYGVMLGQVREILNLPEPKATGDGFPTGNLDLAKQRADLAAYQVSVAKEFAGDVARACKRGRVPKKVRAHACAHQAKFPAELQKAVAPETAALSMRNDQMGEFVMPWWQEVCDIAPKPKDGMPACPME
jgi:hypothetical protein